MRPAGGATRGSVAASSKADPDAGIPRSMKLTCCNFHTENDEDVKEALGQ